MNIANTYADQILTNIVVGYSNPNFYAEQLFPTVMVDKRTGYYFVWDQANLRAEDDLRTGRAESKIVDDEAVKTAYGPLLEHSLKTFIEQDLIDQSDIVNLETARAERLRHRMLLNKEIALADYINGSVTQVDTLAGGEQWSDYTASDPYGDLEAQIEQVRSGSMQKANVVALGVGAFKKLKYHPDTIELLKAQGGGRFTAQLLADWLEVGKVIILDSQEVTSVEGQTVTRGDIWGDISLVMYVNANPSPSTEEASAGYHLQLTNGVVALPAFRDPKEPDTGEWLKVKDYYEQKVVSQGSISLLKAVIA